MMDKEIKERILKGMNEEYVLIDSMLIYPITREQQTKLAGYKQAIIDLEQILSSFVGEDWWIRVEDKMPKVDEIVLVHFDNKYGFREYAFGYVSNHPSTRGDWFTKKGGYAIDNVTHWQSLSDPPEDV